MDEQPASHLAEAERRIALEREQRTGTLDLRGLDLEELPASLGGVDAR